MIIKCIIPYMYIVQTKVKYAIGKDVTMLRNRICLFMLTLGVIMFISACGSNEDSNDNLKQESKTDEITTETKETNGRIVATTVALTEIMDELELDLIGVPTSYKDLPERYTNATEVGMAAEPDMETIRSLKPTDVLSVTTLQNEFNLDPVFENANVPVTFVNMESLDGMYKGIHDLGEKYDRTEQAKAIVKDFESKLAEIEGKVAGKDAPTVLILLGIPGSYRVATEHSYIGDLVKRVGGVNAIQGQDVEFVSSNTEYLQQSNPDVILRAAHGMPDEVVKMFDKEFRDNDIWQHFKAVKNDRVYDLEETRFGTTANLAAADALEELLEMLYSEEL